MYNFQEIIYCNFYYYLRCSYLQLEFIYVVRKRNDGILILIDDFILIFYFLNIEGGGGCGFR